MEKHKIENRVLKGKTLKISKSVNYKNKNKYHGKFKKQKTHFTHYTHNASTINQVHCC